MEASNALADYVYVRRPPFFVFLFVVLALAIFTGIPGKDGMCKAAGPYVVFLDDFEDGDISDWATVTGKHSTFRKFGQGGEGWATVAVKHYTFWKLGRQGGKIKTG